MNILIELNASKTLYEVIVDGVVKYTHWEYFTCVKYARSLDPCWGHDEEFDEEEYFGMTHQEQDDWDLIVREQEMIR